MLGQITMPYGEVVYILVGAHLLGEIRDKCHPQLFEHFSDSVGLELLLKQACLLVGQMESESPLVDHLPLDVEYLLIAEDMPREKEEGKEVVLVSLDGIGRGEELPATRECLGKIIHIMPDVDGVSCAHRMALGEIIRYEMPEGQRAWGDILAEGMLGEPLHEGHRQEEQNLATAQSEQIFEKLATYLLISVGVDEEHVDYTLFRFSTIAELHQYGCCVHVGVFHIAWRGIGFWQGLDISPYLLDASAVAVVEMQVDGLVISWSFMPDVANRLVCPYGRPFLAVGIYSTATEEVVDVYLACKGGTHENHEFYVEVFLIEQHLGFGVWFHHVLGGYFGLIHFSYCRLVIICCAIFTAVEL